MPNSIIKDKNIITITIDNGKERTYTLDINEGYMTNSHGRVLATKPQGFTSTNYNLTRELQNFSKNFTVLGYLLRRVQHNYITLNNLYKYLPTAEKIDALGNKQLGNSITTCSCCNIIDRINEIGLKPFLSWAKEKDYCFGYSDLNRLTEELKLYSIIPKEKIEKLDTFSKDIIFHLANRVSMESFSKHYQRVLYYTENDHFIKYAKNNAYAHHVIDIFVGIIRFATALNCEIPKSKNLFETYNMLEKNYEVWKDTKDNEALAENQNKSYLNFAYGNYVVVVPTTAEEFRKEAFEQKNCVYSTYMPYVINGHTNVVFVRKADQIDKSFITCEVRPDGNIAQYLLANNRRVEDNKELLVFKELYQNHILNNINK